MKVLIAGASGQVGRALIDEKPPGTAIDGMTRADIDITDSAAVREEIAARRPDWVINCAAYTAVDRAEEETEAAMAANGSAVGHLAEACGQVGARLAQLSTDFVFDGENSHPYRPDDRTDPVNAYGRSKLAGEQMALSGGGNLVVRTAWVYGVHGSNFVRTMLRVMAARDEVRVVADQIGTPTHANSLARTVWKLMAREAAGIYHVTDAGVASWYDFAVAIQDEALSLGLLARQVPILPITTADYPTPADRPAFSVLDKSETWSLLEEPGLHWRHELRAMLIKLKNENHD